MIITPNKEESYNNYIDRILQSRINMKDTQNYQERRHIIPKTLGGNDTEDNLIYLYAEEHYYAHKLLAFEYPDNPGLQYAWWNMCQCTQNGERQYNISAEEYALARIQFTRIMKGNQYAKGNKFTLEQLQHMSESHKGKFNGENNPMYGKHCSEHCKSILKEKLSGSNNPYAHKVKCIETNEIFNTVKSASEWCHIGHADIAAYIRGKQKSAGKHPITGEKLHWVYIE